MGYRTAELPPVDLDEFQKIPFLPRMKLLQLHWVEAGFGTPKQTAMFYVWKIFYYSLFGLIVAASFTRGLEFNDIGGWWHEPILYQKLMVWTVLVEILGLAATCGPMAFHFDPPIGQSLYWWQNDTIRIPPYPNHIPFTKGNRRTPWDTGLYKLIVFWLVIAPLWLWTHRRIDNRMILAVAGLIVFVPTWLAFALLQRAPVLLLLLMAVVWIADTAAYFFGHQFGRHKLAPRISPGKTWEGVGGALLCIAVYAAILQYMDAIAQDEKMLVPYLLAMTLFSVEGDLLESWLKRCAGVKDSGTILPGHGGILDRIDALTSALPLAAWLFAAQ